MEGGGEKEEEENSTAGFLFLVSQDSFSGGQVKSRVGTLNFKLEV